MAELIKERADFSNIVFDDLVQADFILMLKMVFSAEANSFPAGFRIASFTKPIHSNHFHYSRS